MSVRSFHSVFMVGGVAAAALSCYLVSLRVASERAALENVESEIVLAQRDIRLLQTEIGTRGRLAQLERWNVKVLLLSAPSADQIVGDSFQLARMVRPEQKLDVEAPVVYASAPAPQPQVLPSTSEQEADPPAPAKMLHEASLKTPVRKSPAVASKLTAPSAKAPAAKPRLATGEVAAKSKDVTPELTAKAKAPAEATAAKAKTPAALTVAKAKPLAAKAKPVAVKVAQVDVRKSSAAAKQPSKPAPKPASSATSRDSDKTR